MQATIHVRTRKKAEVVDVTAQVADLVRRSAVDEGLCTVFVRHATAAVVINENADPGFRLDLVAALDKLFPEGVGPGPLRVRARPRRSAAARHVAGDRPRGVRRTARAGDRGGRSVTARAAL